MIALTQLDWDVPCHPERAAPKLTHMGSGGARTRQAEPHCGAGADLAHQLLELGDKKEAPGCHRPAHCAYTASAIFITASGLTNPAEGHQAERRERVHAAMDKAAAELAKTQPARIANSDAVALASYLTVLGLAVSPDTMNRVLTLLGGARHRVRRRPVPSHRYGYVRHRTFRTRCRQRQ
jgi:hypothetical protein